MPLFSFPKQWLNPHPSFTQRLLVVLGAPVCSHPLHVLFVWVAVDVAHALARRAPLFERAIPARRGIRSVLYALTALTSPIQFLARRAQVEVPLRIIDELAFAEESLAFATALVQRDIRSNVRTLDRPHVLCGTVLGVPGYLMRQ